MTPNEVYVLVLCLLVFTLLTTLFSLLVVWLIKMSMRLIKAGLDDEKIKKEYDTKQKSNSASRVYSILNICLVVLLWGVLLFVLVSTIVISSTENNVVGNMPALKVVKTGSMSYINEKNVYLEENGIDNQIGVNDLVVLHKMPSPEDIKLYDVILYEVDGDLLLHRVVSIIDPDPNDPKSEYQFIMQGDAVEYADMSPAKFSQMKGIYRNERMAFVGSFVVFMQSPAGYICLFLVASVSIATMVFEKYVNKIKLERLKEIGYIAEDKVADEQTN